MLIKLVRVIVIGMIHKLVFLIIIILTMNNIQSYMNFKSGKVVLEKKDGLLQIFTVCAFVYPSRANGCSQSTVTSV